MKKVLYILTAALIVVTAVGVIAFGNKDDKKSSSSKGSYSRSGYSSFTNKYGTPDTKCAIPGCSRNIASSGDTNCCTTHSARCLNCNCYIDSDAMYCMSCISNALG